MIHFFIAMNAGLACQPVQHRPTCYLYRGLRTPPTRGTARVARCLVKASLTDPSNEHRHGDANSNSASASQVCTQSSSP
jgi:hypothetical protein